MSDQATSQPTKVINPLLKVILPRSEVKWDMVKTGRMKKKRAKLEKELLELKERIAKPEFETRVPPHVQQQFR